MTHSSHPRHTQALKISRDKTLTKPDIYRTKEDFERTNQDKISRRPRSNVRNCPLLSAFPGSALPFLLDRTATAFRQEDCNVLITE